jgi:hypothetical protein
MVPRITGIRTSTFSKETSEQDFSISVGSIPWERNIDIWY